MTTTGQPAARADAVSPPAVEKASGKFDAPKTAGGDTASALAAGCPVVVKGHEAHPGTGELVAQAIAAAVARHGLHPGTFSFVQGGSREVGQALVEHPAIRAVGFTGSLAGGRALFDLCAGRPEPIPFFGELGSINPVFLLPAALAARGAEIAQAWVASLTLGAGQFCTNPGLLVALEGAALESFRSSALSALEQASEQRMLTEGIAAAYGRGCDRFKASPGVETRFLAPSGSRSAVAAFFETGAATWLDTPALAEEIFGPAGLLVRVGSFDQMLEIARALEGQLTATLQTDPADSAEAKALMSILQHRAGRILANGFPTGVEVADAMVHVGPYPASTNFGATSVGTLAIRRWLRPVCFQSIPDQLLPDAFRD